MTKYSAVYTRNCVTLPLRFGYGFVTETSNVRKRNTIAYRWFPNNVNRKVKLQEQLYFDGRYGNVHKLRLFYLIILSKLSPQNYFIQDAQHIKYIHDN